MKLLEQWVIFESLSSSDPVSTLVIRVIIPPTVSRRFQGSYHQGLVQKKLDGGFK